MLTANRVYVSSQVTGHSWKAIAEGQGSGRALLCLWSYGQYGCIFYTKKIIKSDFGATLVFSNQLLSLGVTFHGLRSR
ncbi:hypothetical protein NL676_011849 [Syzygium grande]|nr:hypothetical protein NL676_011849 [Syzygium grande]